MRKKNRLTPSKPPQKERGCTRVTEKKGMKKRQEEDKVISKKTQKHPVKDEETILKTRGEAVSAPPSKLDMASGSRAASIRREISQNIHLLT